MQKVTRIMGAAEEGIKSVSTLLLDSIWHLTKKILQLLLYFKLYACQN